MNESDIDGGTVDTSALDFSRMLFMLYNDMGIQNRQADTKAQIFLGVSALLVATVANVAPGFGQLLLSPSASTLSRVGVLLMMGMIVVLVLSIYYALIATAPRLAKVKQQNVFFFGNIASMREEEYIRLLREHTLEEVKTSIMRQIYIRAGIVQRKFRAVNRSGVFLLIGVILWGVSRLALAFA